MNKKRYILIYFILVAGILVFSLLSLTSGTLRVPLSEIPGILMGKGGDEAALMVIYQIRLPRITAAIFLGGALAVSGFLLQSFFNNPIAGPYVLGISSGAKLSVAVFMILLLGRGYTISSLGMVLAAFLGSVLTMGFVLLMSAKVRNMSVLVVCGILVGYICSAITDLMITFADDSNIINLHNWSLGSFSGISWQRVNMLVAIVTVCVSAAFIMSKPIGAYALGESYARNMGVNIKALRIILILLSSILSATVTAFAGPISFVGIAVPHLVKVAYKNAKPILLIPGCFLFGALLTLVCDSIARNLFAPTEVSISSVTAVLLAPVVIYMMVKRSGERR